MKREMGQQLSFHIITFGCQMNKSRSEHLSYLLSREGFIPVTNPEESDILVFNTCAVREHAVERATNAINQMVLKISSQKGKVPTVVVCGCMSELFQKELAQKIPSAKIFVGTQKWNLIPILLKETLLTETKNFLFEREENHVPFLESGYLREEGISAYLPITYGCDNFCSYCVVPYVTGRQRSKPEELVLKEFGEILENGFREIVLLGQNVNSYGKDLVGKPTFEHLLERIEQRFGREKIWVRFITSHPKDMRKDIVKKVKESHIICPYFHFPLQAGSDRILALMNRGYTQKEYLEMADFIRNSFADVGIGTDIIVGFPGETEEDFWETLKVVERVQFDVAYTYIYSPRPRTAASSFQDDVPQKVKEERLAILNNVLRNIHLQKIRQRIGEEVEVLLEKGEEKHFLARTQSNLRVLVKKETRLEVGNWVTIKLRSLHGNKIEGEVYGSE
ncbi:MAG: tRNA (N6-isopentenyl adenosine(37)-C2)-methylthiotransferase MiaB [Candidatus Caldatribacteriaceae bacterium]